MVDLLYVAVSKKKYDVWCRWQLYGPSIGAASLSFSVDIGREYDMKII